jgi:hypothetical protein
VHPCTQLAAAPADARLAGGAEGGWDPELSAAADAGELSGDLSDGAVSSPSARGLAPRRGEGGFAGFPAHPGGAGGGGYAGGEGDDDVF